MEVTDPMSDQDEGRPLTRRERRLREMSAAGATVQAAAPVAPEEQPAPAAEESVPASVDTDIEIPLFDENGRMRSRRELRELREEALAALAAERAAVEAEPAPSEVGEAPADAPVEIPAEEPLAETVAFDVIADLQQEEPEAEADSSDDADAPDAEEAEEAGVEAATEEELEALEAEILVEESVENAPVAAETEAESEDAALEDELAPTVAMDALVADAVAEEAGAEGAVEEGLPEPVSASGQRYSFPDIAPLDEGQSVFDDPAVRMMGAQNDQPAAEPVTGTGFDDLINRAVAQEGAASAANTSALILPNLPETDALARPLGETGELYITGSFELPKSLGETGGHSALHDSVEIEPLDELGIEEPAPTTSMMAPVSASRAVSARGSQGPLVAEAGKDKSKLPVVLIATGGVLVLGAAGLIIWAAASGLFG